MKHLIINIYEHNLDGYHGDNSVGYSFWLAVIGSVLMVLATISSFLIASKQRIDI